MIWTLKVCIVIVANVAISGCKPATKESVKAAPVVRPVLTHVVAATQAALTGFAGTIQPQYQTDRGFQVLGRLITRDVNVGDIVKKGQQLATLDPLVFDLAVKLSDAELAKARAGLFSATAAEGRKTDLRERNVVSQAEFEAAQQGRAAAVALVTQAEANLEKAREQRSYTALKADIDGVVLTTDAEVGQTVAAGRRVMTLARTDSREAVVDLPEADARGVTTGAGFDIKLQSDVSITATGKVRELAPEADSTTRTRRVKITLDRIGDALRLGATVTAFPKAETGAQVVLIPRSAVKETDGATKVWLVDARTKTVKTVPIQVTAHDDQFVQVEGGLPIGSRIVVAGVNSLSEGQEVKFQASVSR